MSELSTHSDIPGFAGFVSDIHDRAQAIGEEGIPIAWTPEHVQSRLIEAFDVLARSGTRVGPRQHANGWPEMLREFSDDVDKQAREAAAKEKLERRRSLPTSDELSRMNEALAWPMAFLDGKPLQSDALMLWAYATALGRDMAAMLHQRKKRAMALAAEIERSHNAPPHVDPDGQVKDTRDPGVLEAYRRRSAIAREMAEIANAEMARSAPTMHAQIRVQARAAFLARCRDAGCSPLQVKPHEAMPGRCLSRTNLDRQRKVAAAAVAAGLRRRGVAVR